MPNPEELARDMVLEAKALPAFPDNAAQALSPEVVALASLRLSRLIRCGSANAENS